VRPEDNGNIMACYGDVAPVALPSGVSGGACHRSSRANGREVTYESDGTTIRAGIGTFSDAGRLISTRAAPHEHRESTSHGLVLFSKNRMQSAVRLVGSSTSASTNPISLLVGQLVKPVPPWIIPGGMLWPQVR